MKQSTHEFENVARLAESLQAKGDYGAAEPLLRQALAARERVIGPEHSDTLLSVDNLAYLLRTKGDFLGAESLYRQALDARERRLGREHPDTLQSVEKLAGLLQAKGALPAAEPLLRRVLEARERTEGPEHPDTLMNVRFLANLLEKMGKSEDSAALRARVAPAQPEPSKMDPYAERQAALELYCGGKYPDAEALLEGLLECGFEPASTRCHLARICLVTDRTVKAREHTSLAWGARDEAPLYVVARVLWLQIAVACLDSARAPTADNGTPTDVPSLLGKLKTVLQHRDAVTQWTMEPILNHLESRLADDHNALLAALLAAMSEGELEALEALESWRTQAPVPLDNHP